MRRTEDAADLGKGTDMGHWAKPVLDPDQTLICYPTLRGSLAADHPIHLTDEILRKYNWSRWEAEYVLAEGQPPIHPRHLAGAIAYGMTVGIRSSRALEEACRSRLDFMLLMEGRTPDHTTFAKFRTRFKVQIRDLFRFLGCMALEMGLARLTGIALDGTRMRANSSRHATATAQTLEERLAELDRQVAEALEAAEAKDREEDTLFGPEATPHRLPRKLSTLKARQEALAKALAKAREAEARRAEAASAAPDAPGEEKKLMKEEGEAKPKKAPKVPVADPDSTIQPNKEGGFAPNYTPLAAVDTHGGFLFDADVLADSDEGQATVATVERIEKAHGAKPAEFLADGKHGSGANLAALEEAGVETYIPLEGRHDRPDNPAHRPDPSVPVPESDWPRLPRTPGKKPLDRAAFVYDPAADTYYCPMGHPLTLHHKFTKHEKNSTVAARVYRCAACAGCPLAGACLKGEVAARTVSRDEHERLREAMDARLRTEAGRATYARRAWACETVFGCLKTVMRLRQFLLRGLDKVKTEWLWTCAAYNLRKLVWALGRERGYRWAAGA
jgi:transposase